MAEGAIVSVIGAGQMGRAIALYLARHVFMKRLVLVDSSSAALEATKTWLHAQHGVRCTEVETCVLDVNSTAELPMALVGASAFAVALPWPQTRRFLERTAGHSAPVVSITRPAYADLDDLQFGAMVQGRAVMLPMGLEPGLTEIFACALARNFDRVEEMLVRCGGVPLDAVPPLGYRLMFDGKLPMRPRPAYVLSMGLIQESQRFAHREEFELPGYGRFEAHLDGMVPWLAQEASLSHVARLMQKTVRRIGFTQAVTQLQQLGLLEGEHFDYIEAAIRARIPPGAAGDITILDYAIRCDGEHHWRWTLVDQCDAISGLSSLARLTGFPAAIAVGLLLENPGVYSGWIQPQTFFRGDLLSALCKGLGLEGVSLPSLIWLHHLAPSFSVQ